MALVSSIDTNMGAHNLCLMCYWITVRSFRGIIIMNSPFLTEKTQEMWETAYKLHQQLINLKEENLFPQDEELEELNEKLSMMILNKSTFFDQLKEKQS